MTTSRWVNGVPENRVSVLDRGLHYGDGIFETMAVRHGQIVLLNPHLERLVSGCRRLEIPAPSSSALREELANAALGQERAVLKLMVTRGEGGRGYAMPSLQEAVRILLRYPWPDHAARWPESGIRAHICETRLGTNPRLAGIKHLNRLEQVLARSEWGNRTDIQEGLMLDADGYVCEGTMTNVFGVSQGGELITPLLDRCGVHGVMRQHILARAVDAGISIDERRLTLAGFLECRELFVCNSVVGVWPMTSVGERLFPVGQVTRQARQWAIELGLD